MAKPIHSTILSDVTRRARPAQLVLSCGRDSHFQGGRSPQGPMLSLWRDRKLRSGERGV